MKYIIFLFSLVGCLFPIQATNHYKEGEKAASVLIKVLPVVAPHLATNDNKKDTFHS